MILLTCDEPNENVANECLQLHTQLHEDEKFLPEPSILSSLGLSNHHGRSPPQFFGGQLN